MWGRGDDCRAGATLASGRRAVYMTTEGYTAVELGKGLFQALLLRLQGGPEMRHSSAQVRRNCERAWAGLSHCNTCRTTPFAIPVAPSNPISGPQLLPCPLQEGGQLYPAFLEGLAGAASTPGEAALWEGVLRDCFAALQGFDFATPERAAGALRRWVAQRWW